MLLPVQNENEFVGGWPIWASASLAGDWFRNDDDEIVVWAWNNGVVNGWQAEFLSSAPSNFGPYPSKFLPVEPGYVMISLAFDGRRFNDSAGMVQIRYPSATDILVAAVRRARWYREE